MARRRLAWPLLAAGIAVALAIVHGDEIRARGEVALGRGVPEREAALARGFVLGEDEGVDPATVEDFRRSGLAHLLAVSGQNVTLLALLAMPLLAGLGLGLRARLVWVLGLIAVYAPLAGGGPTVVRAALMGGLGLLATLAGRRGSRFHALLLAGAAMLAIDPAVARDVGWQLSFAAVLGILLLGATLRRAVIAAIGDGGWRRALADGIAATVAATLATAPLMAFHFEAVSTTTLAANLLALPAVAPAMWLGMVGIAAGQVPGFPAEALNALNGPLLAYIAQVAEWCARPDWAYPEVRLGLGGLLASYAALAASCLAVSMRPRAVRRAKGGGGARAIRPRSPGSVRLSPHPSDKTTNASWLSGALRWMARLAAAAAALWVAAAGGSPFASRGIDGPAPPGLRISFLDVGQGDSVLLRPPRAPALLVDAGPADGGAGRQVRAAGVERLGAVVLSHDQSDHAGGLAELLARVPAARLLHGASPSRQTLSTVRRAGVPAARLARGQVLRSGALRLEVLWPPRELRDGPLAGDPNRLSLVLLARWGEFTALLTGDAEAEATPLEPGPVDLLKVAHHGSADPGLDDLLDRARPRVAVISAGEDNPFGHPDPTTLASLEAHGVRVLRTDREGSVEIAVTGGRHP